MRILVAGGTGMCGRALVERGRARGHEVIAPTRAELDIRTPVRIAADVAINAAGYTDVDHAEIERDAAFGVNAVGAGELARESGVPVLHLSTDYVFDGAATRPYREDDPVAPLSIYGSSKAAGEFEVLDAGGSVIRTSWVFARDGRGFVQNILARLASPGPIEVVDDRHGCPTFADDLADAVIELAERGAPRGIWHYAGDPETTWCGFARAIANAAGADAARIVPVASGTAGARRPAFSVLDTAKIRAFGIAPRPWSIGLARVVR